MIDPAPGRTVVDVMREPYMRRVARAVLLYGDRVVAASPPLRAVHQRRRNKDTKSAEALDVNKSALLSTSCTGNGSVDCECGPCICVRAVLISVLGDGWRMAVLRHAERRGRKG